MNNSLKRVNHKMINHIIKQVLDCREDISLKENSYFSAINQIKEILLNNKYFYEILMQNSNPASFSVENNIKHPAHNRFKAKNGTKVYKTKNHKINDYKIDNNNIEELISILALVNYSIDYYFQSTHQ